MDTAKLSELKKFIQLCRSNPSLSFFRDYLESVGALLSSSSDSHGASDAKSVTVLTIQKQFSTKSLCDLTIFHQMPRSSFHKLILSATLQDKKLYVERLPIGLENVIRTMSSETVKHLYNKWYHLHNMAVIVVGDFPDTRSVVEFIRTHFEEKTSAFDPPIIPLFLVPSHEEPYFPCFVESEAAGSAVMIIYKMPADELKTVKDYRDMLVESMFLQALNQRFFKISRGKDPPYFSCSATSDDIVRPLKAYCKEKWTLPLFEIRVSKMCSVNCYGVQNTNRGLTY